jgi:hypothetical protein
VHIYATRDWLIFVNEPLEFARIVKRFGFKLSLSIVPHTSYRDVMIRYKIAERKPLFFRPKPKPHKHHYYDYSEDLGWWLGWSK